MNQNIKKPVQRILQLQGEIERWLDQSNTGHIWCMALYTQQDQNYLLSCGNDLTIKFWNLNENQISQELQTGHILTILCILVINDLIITGSGDSTVKIFKEQGFFNKEFKCLETIQHQNSILNIVKINSNIFATGSRDNIIHIYSFTNSAELVLLIKLDETASLSSRFRMEISDHFLMAGGGQCLEMFNIKNYQKIGSIESQGICCFSVFQIVNVITGHQNGDIQLWNIQYEPILKFTVNQAHGGDFQIIQIFKIDENIFLSNSIGKKGLRQWKFTKDFGQIMKTLNILEESKLEINSMIKYDNKIFVSDLNEKRITIIK